MMKTTKIAINMLGQRFFIYAQYFSGDFFALFDGLHGFLASQYSANNLTSNFRLSRVFHPELGVFRA